jgi:hypothetical protein
LFHSPNGSGSVRSTPVHKHQVLTHVPAEAFDPFLQHVKRLTTEKHLGTRTGSVAGVYARQHDWGILRVSIGHEAGDVPRSTDD